ncbi:5-oxoprolinase subunit B family protein [Ideonella paludis]|uniref:Allophanate hydrolase subunit 1 n=2 Tax=Ideonella paludis TaxID=1233411 RepID=A0ABS5DXV8_9BURK|nr:allophanate hydrolase subunit 1 [Ideonella paludis]MBQ0935981.1 allophanate hydrolase subunit 1 [Ideonella paludis]
MNLSTPASPPRLLPLGDAAWTLELAPGLDDTANRRVMALADALRAARRCEPSLADVTDVVPSFRSLTVHFDPLRADADALGQWLLTAAQASAAAPHTPRCWRLPLCCDLSVAPDLADLAAATGLSVEAVVSLFSQAPLRVAMIGFMPGFPYMTGLPPALARPRRATPRKAVPARSVAVAGEMACIYPWQSPGGWHLLGRCPLPMFELAHPQQAAWLQAGDEVRWQVISLDALTALEQRVQRGAWRREDFLIPSVEAATS